MRKVIAGIIAAAMGCGTLYAPPIPPEYDVHTCQMYPEDYELMAKMTRDIEAVGTIPTEPQAALDYCTRVITNRGWLLVEKPPTKGPETFLSKFSHTFPSELPVVVLGVGFRQRSIESQAQTMCHEAVHTYQFERLGTGRLAALYAINEGAFSIEVPAYRMTFRVWATQNPNATRAELEEHATEIITNLYEKYGLGNMPRRCAITLGVAILMLDH